MNEQYSYYAGNYPTILERCIADAYKRHGKKFGLVKDIRMWTQRWPSVSCGFIIEEESEEIIILAPTVVVKFDKEHRVVYHNGQWAYDIFGKVKQHYYECVKSRSLPGQVVHKVMDLGF